MNPARTAIVALILLASTACGGGGSDGGLSTTAEGRRRMPSCGAYTATPGELPAEARAVRDCFLTALRAGEQKELTITADSVEGDPLVTIYRVLGPGDVELFVDASADMFAAMKTYHQRCTSVAEEGNALAAGGCVDVP